MSLLRRVERNRNPKQILNLLLARLYPDANQLQQDIRAILDARSVLTDRQEKELDSAPYDFVISFRPHNPNLPIRELLDKLQAQEDLAPHIQAIVAEENIELTEAEDEIDCSQSDSDQ